jgi:hypothetical protein
MSKIPFEEKEGGVKPVKLEETKLNYKKIVEDLKQYFLSKKGLDKGEFKRTIELSKFQNSDFFKIEPQTYASNALKLMYEKVLEEEKNEEKRAYKLATLNVILNALSEILPEKSKDKNHNFCLFTAYVIGILELFDE